MQPWFSTIWRKDVFRRRWLYGLRRFACYGGERYAKEDRTKGHTEHPAGAGAAGTHFGYFRGHSLSVSDIVALKQNGVVSCHYVDSWGFKELPGFLKPENYLKNAEMAMEDDYGMIDGIINNGPRKTVAELEEQSKTGTPISLLELAQAVQREDAEKRRAQQPVRREKSGEKPSILAKLKTPSVADTKSVKSAPKRSAEREL